jgi:hypothetical protein
MEVFEYWDDPGCIFRLRVTRADRVLQLRDGRIEPGESVLEVHFWNEHVPPVPLDSRDVAWGITGARMVMTSFKKLADYVGERPELAGASAVGGVTTWFSPGEDNGAERIFNRLGFELSPHLNGEGGFGEFWERVYAWLLLWAFSAGGRQRSSPLRVPRTDFWMSTREFLDRFETKTDHGSSK